MGVRGLTTYINSSSNNFFVKFELHDCVLVIDGNSLAAVLYCDNLGPYSAFGGDYDILAEHIENFIKNLKKCNVEPVFIFDGGYEVKKASTVRKRNALKVFAIDKVSPDKPSRDFFPLMLRPVLQERLLELGVVTLQSDYEADREIAALAKRLNAPVLSNDSDFFIFDVPYIPLSRFSFDIFRHTSPDSNNQYQYMACEIYYVENFLKKLGRLEKDMLPLLATILGNDYLNRSLFKNFYGLIKLDKNKKVKLGQRRVAGLVQWLKKETFKSALNKILTSLPKKRRQRVKSNISSIIRGYSNVSTSLDKYLPNEIGGKQIGELTEILSELSSLNITDLEETFSKISDDELNDEEDKEDSDSVESSPVEDNEEETDDNKNDSLMANKFKIPEWLLERSRMCQMPPQIITLINLNTYFCVPQMEDCSLPHVGEIGLPILRIISGLILRTDSFSYWFRQGNNSYRVKKIEIDCRYRDISLCTLNKLPLDNRKNILLDTLELGSDSVLDSYPENWHLFLLSFFYWIKHRDTVGPWHIHAVTIMAIVLNIFPTKMGFFRKLKQFKRKYGAKVKSLEKLREKVNAKYIGDRKKTFVQELSEVTIDDCLIVFEDILPYFNVDLTLKERPRTFQRLIIHNSAELQIILDLAQMLNFLLLCPFERIKISKFYNGTFLYNMTVIFKRQRDIIGYLEKLYKQAPNLLHLHMSLYNDLIQFTNFTDIPQSVRNKKRRHRRKKLNAIDDETDYKSLSEDTEFYFDDNNKYSLLQRAN